MEVRKSAARLVLAALVAGTAMAGGAGRAGAAGGTPVPAAAPTDTDKRIRELEDAIQELKKDARGLEVREEERGRLKPIAGWQDGFFVQSTDGAFKLKLGGYAQYDGRFFLDEDSSNSQFGFRRLRPDIRGTLFKYFELRFVPDFAGGSTRVFDAYLDAKFIPELQLRAGKFKPPVGLERLQSATALTFIERSLATNLVPTRDLGFQLQGEVWRGVFNYQAGIFNGAPDLGNPDLEVDDRKEFAGRVFVHPLQNSSLELARGLGLGFAGSYGKDKGTLTSPDLPSYRTPAQATFFSYRTDSPATAAGTTVSDGARYRFSPQGYYYVGPFGLLGEYVSSTQGVRRGAVQEELSNHAWQVAASWVITGENASFKGVKPNQPFDPFAGTWGAFQLAARYAQLTVDDAAFSQGFADPDKSARRANEIALGLNWFVNGNVLVALNYEKSRYDGGAKGGKDRRDEDVVISRVQVAF